jgi:hypothetical protein
LGLLQAVDVGHPGTHEKFNTYFASQTAEVDNQTMAGQTMAHLLTGSRGDVLAASWQQQQQQQSQQGQQQQQQQQQPGLGGLFDSVFKSPISPRKAIGAGPASSSTAGPSTPTPKTPRGPPAAASFEEIDDIDSPSKDKGKRKEAAADRLKEAMEAAQLHQQAIDRVAAEAEAALAEIEAEKAAKAAEDAARQRRSTSPMSVTEGDED